MASVPPFLSPRCQQLADSLIAEMTLAEKASQMIQSDDPYVTPADVQNFALGSVLASANYAPGAGTSAAWAAHIAALHAAARGSRLKIPLLYGLDSMHGMGHARDAIIFPHNIGLGASGDADLVRRVAHASAEETAGSGADWTFSPVVAAARDERWGRTYESFSEDPALAGLLGASSVLGFQGAALGESRSSILASAKHFAGDGATERGIDQGNVVLTEAEFRDLAVSVYVPAIEAGVGAIMVSYSRYQGVPMSANAAWLTNVLKDELQFGGFLVSDYDAVDKLGGSLSENVQLAVNAGLDMLMETGTWRSVREAIVTGVTTGIIPLSRVDDAVTRILRVKCGLGLFERAEPDAALTAGVGSAEHRALAREAVQKSIVMLKNEGEVLPLSKQATRIVVAGSGAKVLRKQMGGWTLDWQGKSSDGMVGTSLLTAVTDVLGPDRVVYQETPSPIPADAVLLAIGEEPYAEYLGDRDDLALPPADSDLIFQYRALNLPIVVVLYSGRPLVITDELAEVDAWIAAFLPGSAAEGLTDVLFGDVAPTAKLSMSWPASMNQIPINVGDADYDADPPLFPFGFGLTY